jgi:phosphopantetheinyl transferase
MIDWHRSACEPARLPGAWVLDIGSAERAARRGIAEDLARRVTGCRGLVLAHDDQGRPTLEGSGTCISMASSAGLLAVALTGFPIGIDIERLADVDPLPLAVLHPDEVAWLGPAPTSLQFLSLWTAKEAFVKLKGRGFRIPPETFAVRLDGNNAIVRHAGGEARLGRETLVRMETPAPFVATCVY